MEHQSDRSLSHETIYTISAIRVILFDKSYFQLETSRIVPKNSLIHKLIVILYSFLTEITREKGTQKLYINHFYGHCLTLVGLWNTKQ